MGATDGSHTQDFVASFDAYAAVHVRWAELSDLWLMFPQPDHSDLPRQLRQRQRKEVMMTKHKMIALAGVVLALAVLSPASALATGGGTKLVNVKGTGSGAISTDPQTGAFTGDVRGVLSHLGKVTVHLEGTAAPTPEGTLTGSGTATIVAANGDRLTGTVTLSTTELLPTGHTATVVITITGGTGRFKGASGTLTVICLVGPPSQVGALLRSTLKCKVKGYLRYGHRRHRDEWQTRAER